MAKSEIARMVNASLMTLNLAAIGLGRGAGPDLATPPTGKDELYAYDGLHRLTKAERGTLSGGSITSPTFTQEWTLESLGDWRAFKQDSNGDGDYTDATDMIQARTHNKVNEIYNATAGAAITEQSSPNQQAQWVDPAYDAAGNMTECPKAGTLADGAAKLKHTWDAWNRPVKVADAYDATVAEYQYDGLGRRIAKWRPWLMLETEGSPTGSFSVGDAVTDGADGTGILAGMADGSWWVEVTGGTTWASSGTITKGANTQEYTQKHSQWRRWDYYYNENWQCVAEGHHGDLSEQDKEANVAATTPYANYLWDIRYIDAPVCRWWDSDGDGTLTDETALYSCNDANMNVTALVGADGTVVERYLYDPYGRVTFLDANFSPRTNNRSAYDNEILYCGYRFNPETNDYHVRHRPLEPHVSWPTRDSGATSQRTSRDSFGLPHRDWSLYEYTNSEPIAHVDPLGLEGVPTSAPSPPTPAPADPWSPYFSTYWSRERNSHRTLDDWSKKWQPRGQGPNCAGYVLRLDQWVDLDPYRAILKQGATQRGCDARCAPCELKIWLWTWTSVPPVLVDPTRVVVINDFHTVAGITGADGSDPRVVMSKNGNGAVEGPRPPLEWAPKNVLQDSGSPSCYCATIGRKPDGTWEWMRYQSLLRPLPATPVTTSSPMSK